MTLHAVRADDGACIPLSAKGLDGRFGYKTGLEHLLAQAIR
jgi:hypothetical protein